MSFLRDYLKYVENNEADEMYHIWSALVVLSSVVSRRIWIDQGQYVVYCNIYVILVGPPGNRKTTGMTVAKNMMREVGGIPFSAEAMTKEGLVKAMAANESTFMVGGIPKSCSPITICVTEFAEFLGASNERMINLLTTVFDQDYYDYKTRNKEDLIIVNPYLTILACDTPDSITGKLKDDVISGGFSRRAAFVYPIRERRRIAFPVVTQEAKDAWARAVQHCMALKDISGEFIMTAEAKQWYKTWYETLKIPQDTTLSGYFEGKQTLLFKVAMLIAASELVNPSAESKLVMEKSYLLTALDLLDQLEQTLSRVFEGMGRNELNAVSTKIVDLLNISKDPISEKNLRAITWKFANEIEFTQAINHLMGADKITAWTVGADRRKMFCIKGKEPSAVRAKLNTAVVGEQAASPPSPAPSDVPKQDSTATSGQPSEQSLAHDDLMSLLQQSQPTVPSVSPPSEVKPPKAD